jgi:MFS superfamily sulfate permease-like transporter
VIHLALAEDVTFINKASIQRTLTQIPDNSKVIIDGSNTIHIDYDVIEIIREFETNAEFRNIDLELIDIENSKIKNQAEHALHSDLIPQLKAPQKCYCWRLL